MPKGIGYSVGVGAGTKKGGLKIGKLRELTPKKKKKKKRGVNRMQRSQLAQLDN